MSKVRMTIFLDTDNPIEAIALDYLESAGKYKSKFVAAAAYNLGYSFNQMPNGTEDQVKAMIMLVSSLSGGTRQSPQMYAPRNNGHNSKTKRNSSTKQKASKPTVQSVEKQSVQPVAQPVVQTAPVPAPTVAPAPTPAPKPQPKPNVVDTKAEEEEVLEYIHNNVDIPELKKELGAFRDDEELMTLLQYMTIPNSNTTYYQKYRKEITDMLMANSKSAPVVDLSSTNTVADNSNKNNTVLGFSGLIDLDDLDF